MPRGMYELKLKRFTLDELGEYTDHFEISYGDEPILMFFPNRLPKDRETREIAIRYVKELLFYIVSELEKKSQ
jgi:hypothetical protein